MRKIALGFFLIIMMFGFGLSLTLYFVNRSDEPLSERALNLMAKPILPATKSSAYLHGLSTDKSPWATNYTQVKQDVPLSQQWKANAQLREEVDRERLAIEKYKRLLAQGDLIEPELKVAHSPPFSIPQALLSGHRWLTYSLAGMAAEGGHWPEIEKWIRLENRMYLSYIRQSSLLGVMIANVVWDNNLQFLTREGRLNPKYKISREALASFSTPDAKAMMEMAMLGEFRFFTEVVGEDWRSITSQDKPWYQRALYLLPKSWVLRPNEAINREADFVHDLLDAACADFYCLSSVQWACTNSMENPAGKATFRLVMTGLSKRYDKLKLRVYERTRLLQEADKI